MFRPCIEYDNYMIVYINQRYIADLHFNFNKQRFNLTQTQHRYWIQFNSKFHLESMHNIHYIDSLMGF